MAAKSGHFNLKLFTKTVKMRNITRLTALFRYPQKAATNFLRFTFGKQGNEHKVLILHLEHV